MNRQSKRNHSAALRAATGLNVGLSLKPTTSVNRIRERESDAPARTITLTPLSELDFLIAQGWGDTPQIRIPDDWKSRKGPGVIR